MQREKEGERERDREVMIILSRAWGGAAQPLGQKLFRGLGAGYARQGLRDM